MVEKSERKLPKIGYLYHYPKLDHPTEKFRLDIFVSSVPTEQHFDVLRAHFFVKTAHESIARLTVTHPWNYEKSARVCAGVVIMEDRKGKKEEAFTFGGQLKIEGKEQQTVCNLVSPATILEISRATSKYGLFIDELEIILAEQQARYRDRQEYEKQLCGADPFRLYLACLRELIQKLESFQHKDENYQQLLIFLHSEEHRLEEAGLLEKPIPTLETIFE
jgi:hypothetical protein